MVLVRRTETPGSRATRVYNSFDFAYEIPVVLRLWKLSCRLLFHQPEVVGRK
jgi:hypothetical protein